VTTRRAAVALAVACWFFLGASGAAHARSKSKKHRHHHHRRTPHGKHTGSESSSEGRKHLKLANALAGEGDCAAAIEEYTKAFELLDDPAVLFNRAECYRRTGDAENAVDDYRAFLDKVPSTPSRAAIEAKIVALEAPEPTPREKPAAEPPVPPPPPPPPKVAEAPAPPPPPAPRPEVKPEPAIVIQRAPTSAGEDAGPAGGSRPWVWVALSVLVVGVAVGGYLLLRPRDEPPPDTVLGNYRL
jgi:tetratricopeptide (TPR) repeat protein